jgi:hypothetical protein
MPTNFRRMMLFVSVPVMFVYIWSEFIKKYKDKYFRIMRWIVISTMISIVMAWGFRDQSIILGYRATASAFVLLFFFYLCKRKLPLKFIEKYIWVLGILYILLWLFAMYKVPEIIFQMGDADVVSEDTSRGMIRINFVGRLSLILAYFMALNKYYETKEKKFIPIVVVLYLFIVFQLTRQLILWTAVVTIIYIFSKSKKVAIAFSILFVVFYMAIGTIQFSDDSIIGSMVNLTEQQAENNSIGDEDIRATEYKYFFTKWSNSLVTDIFGCGVPHSDSSYGMFEKRASDMGLWLSDVGYGEMKVITGWLGLFLYLFLFISCLFVKMPSNLEYTKLFMGFMIPANIAADWYIKVDGQIAMVICAYLITRYRIRNNKIKNEIQHHSTGL